jgi:hypothetical protein
MFPEITRETFTRVVMGISICGADGAHDTARAAQAISTDDWIIPTSNEYRCVIGPASAGRTAGGGARIGGPFV